MSFQPSADPLVFIFWDLSVVCGIQGKEMMLQLLNEAFLAKTTVESFFVLQRTLWYLYFGTYMHVVAEHYEQADIH